MKRTRALRRLGRAGVVAGTVVALMPAIGITAASAATGSITLVDPCQGAKCDAGGTVISTLDNGTDHVVHLYADVAQSTGSDPRLVTANFLAHDDTADPTNSSPPTVVASAAIQNKSAGADIGGDDAYAVSSFTPSNPGDQYTISVQAVDANNATVQGTDNAIVTYSNTAHSVRITRPSANGLFGYYAYTGLYNVTGTASTNGDPLQVSEGFGNPATDLTYQGTSQRWAADMPGSESQPAPTAGNNLSIELVQALNTSSHVSTSEPGTAYLQNLASSNGFSLDNPTQFAPVATYRTYTLKAVDQNGNPIANMPFTLAFSNGGNDANITVQRVNEDGSTTDITPTSNSDVRNYTTDAFGTFTFRIQDSHNESTNIQAKSEFNGSFNPASDYTVNGTFTTAPQTAVGGTATVVGHPTAPLYASQSYGMGNAQNGPTPGIKVTVTDSNNQPAPNASIEYQYTRTIVPSTAQQCGDNTTYPQTVGPTTVNSDNTGTVFITPDPVQCPDIEAGQDAYTIYLEKNGTPGFQQGADTLIGTETLQFGPEQIYFQPCDQLSLYVGGPDPDCNAQQKAGVDKTLTIFAAIFDGTQNQPIAGRKIDISLTNGNGTAGTDYGFSPNNNSGFAPVNSTSGDITTDNNGTASVTLFDNNVDEFTVTASDPTLGTVTTDNGTDTVEWRSYQAVLDHQTGQAEDIATGQVTPIPGDAGEHPGDGGQTVGAPGQPLIQGFQFLDQNNQPLRNEIITLKTDAGFFTDLPNEPGCQSGCNDGEVEADAVSNPGISGDLGPEGYATLNFDTAPADGQPVKGDLHSDGTTQTIITDAAGDGYFNLGILSDPGFANFGDVIGNVTSQLNGAGNTVTLDDHQVLFSTDSADYFVAALNPGSFKVLEGTVDDNGAFQPGTAAPSGKKATATKDSIPVDTVYTYATATDSFGNPISEWVNAASTGPGNLSNSGMWTSYKNINGVNINGPIPPSTDPDADQDPMSDYVLQDTDPASVNPSTGSQAIGFAWYANTDNWLVNTTTKTTSVDNNQSPQNQLVGLDWYVRDPTKFHYKTTFIPGQKEPANTPISISVTVTDNENRAVPFLPVEFVRNGPAGEVDDTGNPYTCIHNGNNCQNFPSTDATGTAGYTFVTNKAGLYKMTTIVTDLNGNELGRSVAYGLLKSNQQVTVTLHTHRGATRFVRGTSHTLSGRAPAHQQVTVYRNGHVAGTTTASKKGRWSLNLIFTKSGNYYAKSQGVRSNTVAITVHSKHKKHRRH